MDYDASYGEEVLITLRAYPFVFRHMGACEQALCHDWYGVPEFCG